MAPTPGGLVVNNSWETYAPGPTARRPRPVQLEIGRPVREGPHWKVEPQNVGVGGSDTRVGRDSGLDLWSRTSTRRLSRPVLSRKTRGGGDGGSRDYSELLNGRDLIPLSKNL